MMRDGTSGAAVSMSRVNPADSDGLLPSLWLGAIAFPRLAGQQFDQT